MKKEIMKNSISVIKIQKFIFEARLLINCLKNNCFDYNIVTILLCTYQFSNTQNETIKIGNKMLQTLQDRVKVIF